MILYLVDTKNDKIFNFYKFLFSNFYMMLI